MKKLILLALSLLPSVAAFAQGTIKGHVKDETELGVPLANMLVLKQSDSSIVKLGVTDSQGNFEIPGIPAGQYMVSVSMIGYQKLFTNAFSIANGQTIDLASLLLLEDKQQLDEVEIVAQKQLIEVQADRTVVNVAASPTAVGKDALEMLQKSPGIVVDKDDNILLQGKNGTQIYIDGKPSPLSAQDLAAFLRSIQATDIETIEIITNPSAKYEAAGNAGIINIRLKKNENFGTNGSAMLGYSQGVFGKRNGSLSINNRTAKLNTFTNVSVSQGHWWNRQSFNREIAGTSYKQVAIQDNRSQSVNFKAGMDYTVNKKSTLGMVLNGNIFAGGPNNLSRTLIQEIGAAEPSSVLIAQGTGDRERQNVNTNLNYRYVGTTGRELSIDLDYGIFRNSAEILQPNYYRTPDESASLFDRIYQNNTYTDIDIYTAKLDYELPFKKGKLGIGGKISWVKTNNDFDFYNVIEGDQQIDLERTNLFIYRENVNAAYVSYKKKVDKFSYQLGIRAEQTNSTGDLISELPQNDDRVERHYLNLFPSAGVTYNVNQKHTLGLSYSRRIDRPNYQDLNPFEYRLDELTFSKGNPFLRPQYTHNVQATHTFAGTVNTALSYSFTDDYFARIMDSTGNGRSALIQKNLATYQNLSLSVSVPMPVTKWWDTYTNLNAFHSIYEANFGEGQALQVAVTSFNANQQHTFSLPHDFKLELTGIYSSPSIWGGTFRIKSQWGIDIGIQKKIMKDRGVFKLSYTDIFRTMFWRGTSDFGGIALTANGAWESQQIRANLTYRFGNTKMKGSRQRSTGAQEENNRLGGGQ